MTWQSNSQEHLTGRMLIAMPAMGDARFAHSVVFLCDHSDEGAMGLVINKPSKDVDLPSLMSQLSIDLAVDLSRRPVHFGGPVEMGRGFVLHSAIESGSEASLEVRDDIHMTATLDILEDLAQGTGPQQWLLALGYAGWGAGQLESELSQNAWLVCDASPKLVFDTADAQKWDAALETLGVSAMLLSSEGGRA